MITTFLLIIFVIIIISMVIKRKFVKLDEQGKSMGISLVSVLFAIAFLFLIIFQPYSLGKIDAGHQGLLTKLTGEERGVSSIKEVSGFIIYNSYTEEIQEIPLDQRSIRYGEQPSVAKGGFPLKIFPSFNYSVKPGTTADMFTNLRTSFRSGGLEAIEQGWLEIGILGAVNDVTNAWKVEDIFNKKTEFEIAIQVEANKRVGKWFKITQLRTNIVIKASSEALSLKYKQRELTPLYVDYLKAQRWNGQLPTHQLGNAGTLINLK
jgi:hypothetical protein